MDTKSQFDFPIDVRVYYKNDAMRVSTGGREIFKKVTAFEFSEDSGSGWMVIHYEGGKNIHIRSELLSGFSWDLPQGS